MKKVIFLATSLASLGVFANTETREFEINNLSEVSIESISGDITITASTSNKATVTANKKNFSDKCKLEIYQSGDEIKVKVKRSSFMNLATDCTTDLTLQVPRNIDTEIELATGNVEIQGLEGQLDYEIGKGNLVATGSFYDVDGDTGLGSVKIDGMTGEGDFKVGKGDIDLKYTKQPTGTELEITGGNTNSTVSFPSGTIIRTKFVGGVGNLTNNLGEDPKANFLVYQKTGVGNLTINSH